MRVIIKLFFFCDYIGLHSLFQMFHSDDVAIECFQFLKLFEIQKFGWTCKTNRKLSLKPEAWKNRVLNIDNPLPPNAPIWGLHCFIDDFALEQFNPYQNSLKYLATAKNVDLKQITYFQLQDFHIFFDIEGIDENLPNKINVRYSSGVSS